MQSEGTNKLLSINARRRLQNTLAASFVMTKNTFLNEGTKLNSMLLQRISV